MGNFDSRAQFSDATLGSASETFTPSHSYMNNKIMSPIRLPSTGLVKQSLTAVILLHSLCSVRAKDSGLDENLKYKRRFSVTFLDSNKQLLELTCCVGSRDSVPSGCV